MARSVVSFVFFTMKTFHIQKLLREPLFHFLIIGAGLFFLFNQIGEPGQREDNRIVITQADLDRLASVWLRRAGRLPSAQEREQQLDHYIREQVLYREAQVLGLDKDDIIVRRRLAQKMGYLFNDLSFIPEPTEDELRLFLADNPSQFTVPANISFSHIYFNPDSRGQKVYEDAQLLLIQLLDSSNEVIITNSGDRSLLPYDYSEVRENELTSIFGQSFASQIFTLPVGSWQGPLHSEYGVHLIFIKSHLEAQFPTLTEIKEQVASKWRAEKEREANETFFQSLLQRYDIIIKDVTKNTLLLM
jgi:peptidyl-prolyl cis-trans isomerase C